MLTDTLADTITRIRNAQRAGHKSVSVRSSNLIRDFLRVLRDEGFIESFEAKNVEGKRFSEISVVLRYQANGEPVIADAQRVSKSGRRIYRRGTELPKVEHGLGLAVISTSKGIMADRIARKEKIGGEVLAYIR